MTFIDPEEAAVGCEISLRSPKKQAHEMLSTNPGGAQYSNRRPSPRGKEILSTTVACLTFFDDSHSTFSNVCR